MATALKFRAAALGLALVGTLGVAAVAGAASAQAYAYNTFKPVRSDGFKVQPSVSDTTSTIGIYSRGHSRFGPTLKLLGYSAETQILNQSRAKGEFGEFGRIDMRFHRTGPYEAQPLNPNCSSGEPDEIAPGVWKGKVRFRSEKGLVNLDRRKLPGESTKVGHATDCHYPSFPGVSLSASQHRDGGRQVSFFAFKETNSDHRPELDASIEMHKKGAYVSRSTQAHIDRSDLTYEPDFSAAKVEGRVAFDGIGRYRSSSTQSNGSTIGPISGDLGVKLLGRDKPLSLNFSAAALRVDDAGD